MLPGKLKFYYIPSRISPKIPEKGFSHPPKMVDIAGNMCYMLSHENDKGELLLSGADAGTAKESAIYNRIKFKRDVASGIGRIPVEVGLMRFRQFKSYHWEWLVFHPHREPEWLAERLKDGFDVHHIDGCHENDDGYNLVLIECQDHFSLHNGSTRNRLVRLYNKKAAKGIGKKAYTKRKTCYMPWNSISAELGVPSALATAKVYAGENDLEWPIQVPWMFNGKRRTRVNSENYEFILGIKEYE